MRYYHVHISLKSKYLPSVLTCTTGVIRSLQRNTQDTRGGGGGEGAREKNMNNDCIIKICFLSPHVSRSLRC